MTTELSFEDKVRALIEECTKCEENEKKRTTMGKSMIVSATHKLYPAVVSTKKHKKLDPFRCGIKVRLRYERD